jgi:hypothetical protein
VIIAGFEPIAVFSTIAEHEVTDLFVVPTMVQLLVDHPRLGDSTPTLIINGGDDP